MASDLRRKSESSCDWGISTKWRPERQVGLITWDGMAHSLGPHPSLTAMQSHCATVAPDRGFSDETAVRITSNTYSECMWKSTWRLLCYATAGHVYEGM
jgi:hypothetical protein